MPFITLKQDENNETQLDEGIFVDIFKELSNLLNFTFTVTSPLDKQYGGKKSDGNWTGMIGQLVERDVDVGKFSNLVTFCLVHLTPSVIGKVGKFHILTSKCNHFSAIGWFAITQQRSQAITFSTPIDEVFYSFFIQNPIESYNLKAYTSTLKDLTWLMFLAWIIVTPPILFIVARY